MSPSCTIFGSTSIDLPFFTDGAFAAFAFDLPCFVAMLSSVVSVPETAQLAPIWGGPVNRIVRGAARVRPARRRCAVCAAAPQLAPNSCNPADWAPSDRAVVVHGTRALARTRPQTPHADSDSAVAA